MTDVFEKNAAVVAARWPAMFARLAALNIDEIPATLTEGLSSTLSIQDIQLSSRHDRRHEAVVQARDLDPDAAEIWLYGTGLGDLPRLLLERPKLRRLHVRLLNEAVFALVLHLIDQSDWVADARVTLGSASDDGAIRRPFFALPPELILADEQNARVRDRLVAEIERPFSNKLYHEGDQARVERFGRNLKYVLQDTDVANLFGTWRNEVYVLASGPTLQRHYEFLRRQREQASRPLFVCVDTAWKPLVQNGVHADFVVTLDDRIGRWSFPGAIPPETKLVYFPFIRTELLAKWTGARYVAFTDDIQFEWFRHQGIEKARLFASGSVIHPAIDLAVKMGAGVVRLFGADFSFPDNKTHTGWESNALTGKVTHGRHWLRNGFGERVATQPNLCAYLHHLEDYIASHPAVRFVNMSQAGALIAGSIYDREYCR